MGRDKASIGKIAGDVIKKLSKERRTKEARIKRVWQCAAGKRFAKHTRLSSFRRKRLVVNVDSSGWLYELSMNRDKITSRLKKVLKDDFSQLQFRIGNLEEEEQA